MTRPLIFVLVACAFPWYAQGCQVVEGDNITGKDLAAADPLFTALDPDLRISSTPSPGAMQVLRPERLAILARQAGIAVTAPIGEVCFERATELLSVEKLMPVLRDALAMEGAEIKILDFSRLGIPRGTLEFPRAALTAAGLWRGHVAYSSGRSAPVWAKVQVTTQQTWIEAAEILPAGQPIEARQLVIRKGPRFPFGKQPLESNDLALGRAALRAIQPGVPICAFMLVTPREVERGDKVKVEVISGAAVLRFEASAESSGHTGESILVRNPENGRRFRVRVEARGKVSLKT